MVVFLRLLVPSDVFSVVMSQPPFQTHRVHHSDSSATDAPLTLTQFWGDFHADLWKFIRPRVGSDAACDDLLQSAFLRATRAITAGTVPEQPRAWLHQIARNLIVDSYRNEGRKEALQISLAREGDVHETSPAPVEDARAADIIARMLPRFVELLAEPYRTAVQLIDLRGLSHAQAAESEKVSLTCMKARVRRGRKQLLDALLKCCSFEMDGRGLPISCAPRTATPCDGCS